MNPLLYLPKWAFFLFLLPLSGCGYNTLQAMDEEVNAAWSEVQNQYQRRFDLVPNLVETVKGFAAQEREVLTQVVEARSKVGQVKLSPAITQDPEAFKRFEAAQGELSGALSRLMVVVERYPELRSNQNFLTLQAQLEGTENRIAVARRDYIQAVRRYNSAVRAFPTNLTAKYLLHLQLRENFGAEKSAQEAPKVKF
ncbi:MAG TPA: LemA family protein [Candidatus Manganitrophaceae bacterium]|nr:LemA family protein [Candidatus Manganitrophaceae bacterium]